MSLKANFLGIDDESALRLPGHVGRPLRKRSAIQRIFEFQKRPQSLPPKARIIPLKAGRADEVVPQMISVHDSIK